MTAITLKFNSTEALIRKALLWSRFAMIMAIYALLIDVLIQYVGLKYSISDPIMLFARVSVCIIINLAIYASPQFRHLKAHTGKPSAGKWFSRTLWALCALPVLLIVSALGTSTTLSGMISAQAKQIDQSRDITALCIKMANQASSAVATTEKTMQAQQRIRHISKSSATSAEMTKQLASAANSLDCIKEQQEMAGMVKQDEMTKVPLSIINALLPPDREINTEQFLNGFYTSLTFSLLLVVYFFSELSTAMTDRAIKLANGINDVQDGPETVPDTTGPLTDKQILAAIDAKIADHREKMKNDPKLRPLKASRKAVAKACTDMYDKARKGETLDKFIPLMQKRIDGGFFKLKAAK